MPRGKSGLGGRGGVRQKGGAMEPRKPTMLWDGDCAFCAYWIRRWARLTGDAVEYRPFQQGLDKLPQVDPAACARAVQLVLPDGRVLEGAHAVLQSLVLAGRAGWMLRCYERSALCRKCAEAAYRFVAANRAWLPGSRGAIRR